MVLEILVGLTLAISVVNFVLNIIVLRKVKFNEFRMQNQIGQGNQADGVVFCPKCNSRYSSALQKCPSCGAPRR